MKQLIIFTFFVFSSFYLSSQDAIFSQFHLSPLNLNPALTGAECGDQVIINYRNQWKGLFTSNAFHTAGISYDRSFNFANGDKIGGGMNLIYDRSPNGTFTQSGAGLAFSYQKEISNGENNEQFLVAGIRGGWAQWAVEFLDLNWGTQHNGMGGFDPTLSSGEDFDKNRVNYADFAAGLGYLANFKKVKNIRFGISGYHINRPNVSFDKSVKNNIYRRFNFHGQAEILTGIKFSILPRFIYSNSGPSDIVIVGSGLKYRFGKEQNQSLEIGGFLRGANNLDNGIGFNGVLFSAAYNYKNFGLSVLGEKNRGFLPSSGGIDSWEIAFLYRFCN